MRALVLTRAVCARSCLQDTGLFGVYAVSEPTRAHTTAYHVIYELARLANNVTEEEVARARQQAKQAVFAELDGTEGVANDIGVQVWATSHCAVVFGADARALFRPVLPLCSRLIRWLQCRCLLRRRWRSVDV